MTWVGQPHTKPKKKKWSFKFDLIHIFALFLLWDIIFSKWVFGFGAIYVTIGFIWWSIDCVRIGMHNTNWLKYTVCWAFYFVGGDEALQWMRR